jgi:hypothetical protein
LWLLGLLGLRIGLWPRLLGLLGLLGLLALTVGIAIATDETLLADTAKSGRDGHARSEVRNRQYRFQGIHCAASCRPALMAAVDEWRRQLPDLPTIIPHPAIFPSWARPV